jgi:chemotaxis methyl-accepting protein methylase
MKQVEVGGSQLRETPMGGHRGRESMGRSAEPARGQAGLRDASAGPPFPRFRVQRVFSLPVRFLESARAATESAVARGAQRGRTRVWVPCCKTGGIAYAVAMLLSDAVVDSVGAPKLYVFGTDVDEEALDMARGGRYPTSAALDMNPIWRAHYTLDDGDTIRVSEQLRRVCIFSRHELSRHVPMARIDLLVCQRVFSGLSAAKRRELVKRFHFALREGGSMLALDHVDEYPSARRTRAISSRLAPLLLGELCSERSNPMLRSLIDLNGYTIRDGDRGNVGDFLFDDARWAVRYLVAETGSIFRRCHALISPISFREADWPSASLPPRAQQGRSREQPRSRPRSPRIPAARTRVAQLLGIFALLGIPRIVGDRGLSGGARHAVDQSARPAANAAAGTGAEGW